MHRLEPPAAAKFCERLPGELRPRRLLRFELAIRGGGPDDLARRGYQRSKPLFAAASVVLEPLELLRRSLLLRDLVAQPLRLPPLPLLRQPLLAPRAARPAGAAGLTLDLLGLLEQVDERRHLALEDLRHDRLEEKSTAPTLYPLTTAASERS